MTEGQKQLLYIIKKHIENGEPKEATEAINAMLEGDRISKDRPLSLQEFRKSGGPWLGAARSWIQWHCINGSDVTWGSNEELRMSKQLTVQVVEEIAAEAAYAEYLRTQAHPKYSQ